MNEPLVEQVVEAGEVGSEPRVKARVILIINGTDFGGTESALAEIALRLADRGYGVLVLSLKPPGKLGASLAEQGIEVQTLGMGELVGLGALLKGIWRLRSWLRDADGEILHSFLPRANIMSRAANRLARPRRPHFSSERSTDFKRSRLVCWLNRWTVPWTERVLVVSPMIERILTDRDGLPGEKLSLLQNGIDVGAVDAAPSAGVRESLGLDEGVELFCTVGRLIPDKGYHYLLEAMARMDHRSGIHLALVGSGPEEDRLRGDARRLGLESQVHFLGYRRDVYSILKEADAFVLSSLEEGVPVVVLEAMACGLPVVATRVGGVSDLVVEAETGFLVPAEENWEVSGGAPRERGDGAGVAALAEAMDLLVADPARRRELGRNGRRRVEEQFDIERVLTQLESYYAAVQPPEVVADAR